MSDFFTLNPSEFPPNASPGTGFASVEIDTLANTLALHVGFSDLIGTTMAAHIHCCVDPLAILPTAGVGQAYPTLVPPTVRPSMRSVG